MHAMRSHGCRTQKQDGIGFWPNTQRNDLKKTPMCVGAACVERAVTAWSTTSSMGMRGTSKAVSKGRKPSSTALASTERTAAGGKPRSVERAQTKENGSCREIITTGTCRRVGLAVWRSGVTPATETASSNATLGPAYVGPGHYNRSPRGSQSRAG